MRLPGTRYQEPGWEQVRKLLGQCSLHAFARCEPRELLAAPDPLALYVDLVAEALHEASRSARAQAAANGYGETALELALALLYELRARPADWLAFCAAIEGEQRRAGPFWREAGGEALLRKKVNDMFAVLRDKVDADNYQAACGRPCSPNRIYAYRMLDTAWREIAGLLAGWREHAAQVGEILGRDVQAEPIEARLLRSAADCRAEWILRWSASLERHAGKPGPLDTRSKRFASLKDNPARIAAMLREIGEYEELSANRDQDWLFDAGEAADWMEDYWRVLDESAAACTPGPDLILEARQEDPGEAGGEASAPAEEPVDDGMCELAQRLSLPPRYVELVAAAQDGASWTGRMLAQDSLAVRLAVYLKLLGPFDDCYPDQWLDPATGELPTMQQLAGLACVSLPTLRKRRDAAIARLLDAALKENG